MFLSPGQNSNIKNNLKLYKIQPDKYGSGVNSVGKAVIRDIRGQLDLGNKTVRLTLRGAVRYDDYTKAQQGVIIYKKKKTNFSITNKIIFTMGLKTESGRVRSVSVGYWPVDKRPCAWTRDRFSAVIMLNNNF